MTNPSVLPTRTRILDSAERVYAHSGLFEFTLRSLSETAGVNLAAINYHFRSKEALVEAMLVKVLSPLYEERDALLRQLKAEYGHNLQPTHIMAALILPLIREISSDRDSHRLSFMLQSASDTHPMVRRVIENRFSPICLNFDRAIETCSPELAPAEALWRSRVFCNAMPGSVNNRSTGEMCASILMDRALPVFDAMLRFGCLAESVLIGISKKAQVAHVVSDLLERLAGTPTMQSLSTLMRVV